MLEEFQGVLQTPKQSPTRLLNKIQDMILNCLEEFLPSTFDFSFVTLIYQQELGVEKAEKLQLGEPISLTLQQQISLNYRIVQYFVQCLKPNFINPETYQALEEQTQKAQSTIRSHIKIEQQMKMYLQYLEAKVHKYQKEIQRHQPDAFALKRELEVLKNQKNILYRQKVNLIKRNQELLYELSNYDNASSSTQSNMVKMKNRGSSKRINYLSIKPDDARACESKFNSSQTSPHTKEKDHFIYMANQYDLTQKKQSTYFPDLT